MKTHLKVFQLKLELKATMSNEVFLAFDMTNSQSLHNASESRTVVFYSFLSTCDYWLVRTQPGKCRFLESSEITLPTIVFAERFIRCWKANVSCEFSNLDFTLCVLRCLSCTRVDNFCRNVLLRWVFSNITFSFLFWSLCEMTQNYGSATIINTIFKLV